MLCSIINFFLMPASSLGKNAGKKRHSHVTLVEICIEYSLLRNATFILSFKKQTHTQTFIEHLFCTRHCSMSCNYSSEQNWLVPAFLEPKIINKQVNIQGAGGGQVWERWQAAWQERPCCCTGGQGRASLRCWHWGRDLREVRERARWHPGEAHSRRWQQGWGCWGRAALGVLEEQWGDQVWLSWGDQGDMMGEEVTS